MKQDKNSSTDTPLKNRLDWVTTIIPFVTTLALCSLFMIPPDASSQVLGSVRFFLGDQSGSYYLSLGLGALTCSLYVAFSRYGKIKLGNLEKPQYSVFQRGFMIFTAGLAIDILFYSLCEWMFYVGEPHATDMGVMQDWASTYPLFHWGSIPWSFYIILAASFSFIPHVHKRNRQKYSEAYRLFLGGRVNGLRGKLIDLTAVFALLAGTATTSSLAALLFSTALNRVLDISENNFLTIGILAITCVVYTMVVYFGMQGIAKLAASYVYLFFGLLAYFLPCGGETRYIIETGITTVGNTVQNFMGMATWIDITRTSSFPQNWATFYWAHWMVWCVAIPSSIGTISKGRTIRQIVLGGYFLGLSGIFASFTILGNYGLGLQMRRKLDLMGVYVGTGDLYQVITPIFEAVPLAKAGLVLLVTTMIAFYATPFDALIMVASSYSYKSLGAEEEPHKQVKLLWSILLMLLSIALISAENSIADSQTVSTVVAFLTGFIIITIVWSFFRDARHYLDKENSETQNIR